MLYLNKSSQMKFIVVMIMLGLIASIEAMADTTDYWHVFYNNKVLVKYPVWPNNPRIVIKAANVGENDTLSVMYGDDTPCRECIIGLYVLDEDRKKQNIITGIGTFTRLKVPVKKLLRLCRSLNTNTIDIYYFDPHRNTLIFRLAFN
jgi:hypothetical protein